MIQLRPETHALLIGAAALCGAGFILACLRYRVTKSLAEISRLVAIIFMLAVMALAPERTMKALLFALLIMWTGEALQWWRKRQQGKSQTTTPSINLTP